MTLGQFATAVGAAERWVQNAFQALRLRPVYTEPRARRLALARAVNQACGMPLRQAFALAEHALARWPEERVWQLAVGDGTLRVEVDLERWLSAYAARLSLARCWYAARRRGRPPKRRRGGIAGAKQYGVDVTLLQESLKLTPGERLRRLEEAVAFFRRAKRRA
jgi:hypothetical protein